MSSPANNSYKIFLIKNLRLNRPYLFLSTTDGEIADGPRCLLLCLELPAAEVVDDEGDEPGVDHGLHLPLVARSDVGQEPHGLLKYTHNEWGFLGHGFAD
jgi:hypothetical protein